MMRKLPANSMQKTYDECYLICSTAIYFEGQNNEAEALRAWRNALDQIYYHNAYRMPSGWTPRTETDKALHESLRAMELQCKERVDLLEALQKSRADAEEERKNGGANGAGTASVLTKSSPSASAAPANSMPGSWLGGDTVPPTSYADLPVPKTSTPEKRPEKSKRPSFMRKKSSERDSRSKSFQASAPTPHLAPPVPAVETKTRRTPSPEKEPRGMLKTLRSGTKERPSGGKTAASSARSQPAAARAATQVWSDSTRSTGASNGASLSAAAASAAITPTWDPYTRQLVERPHPQASDYSRPSGGYVQPPSPSDYQSRPNFPPADARRPGRRQPPPYPDYPPANPFHNFDSSNEIIDYSNDPTPLPPPPPPHRTQPPTLSAIHNPTPPPPAPSQPPPSSTSYMRDYPSQSPKPKTAPPIPAKRAVPPASAPAPAPVSKPAAAPAPVTTSPRSPATRTTQANAAPVTVARKAVNNQSKINNILNATAQRQKVDNAQASQLNGRWASVKGTPLAIPKTSPRKPATTAPPPTAAVITPPPTDSSQDSDTNATPAAESHQTEWDARVARILKNLPKGVDETAAKQIFNEIVIQGDEVHWDDVAGLDIAKSALKETVVYPFLRPDLFMGLREPARGMLLFGPPGTGKTMLARAVATESKSVFFAISASSLTSKFLGESEKLVRALFVLAKELAPSIIFVDEIDSLLGARGGGSEHEATRRIKTEFLIQWSDLQRAAAGREPSPTEGDASRVLVLAATNLPWAIDEAARRRFVRRQYIPLPEDHVRERQLRTLLARQKHRISERDMKVLVGVTEGYSGSDITALAKDAAMGPLRSLGEQLLHMSPDEIRPIDMRDFEASLVNIRPSVSKQGLKEFEDWAREFGERGG